MLKYYISYIIYDLLNKFFHFIISYTLYYIVRITLNISFV